MIAADIAMSDDLISVIDFARQQGAHKQSIFKILRRLGVEPTKRSGTNNRGQLVSYITKEDADLVSANLRPAKSSDLVANEESNRLLEERGVFYLICLEPKSDPGRFKVGFATTLSERLRQLRCSAPFIEIIATWPCKRLWERTAIDCVTEGCERLHTEIFRTMSLTAIREKCDQFFALMPKLATKPTGS